MKTSSEQQSMHALIVDDEFHEQTATGRALRSLAKLLEDGGVALTPASTVDAGARACFYACSGL